MKSTTKQWVAAAFLVGTTGAMGCSMEAAIDVPNRPNNATGTITQRWSIGGRFDPNLCTMYGADKMELVIRDVARQIVARAYQPCEEMQMTVNLVPGSYVGDAVLIGTDGSNVSTTLSLRPFRILANTDTLIDTDFPISSMLTVLGESESPADAGADYDEESP